jgi:hypothetical protein
MAKWWTSAQQLLLAISVSTKCVTTSALPCSVPRARLPKLPVTGACRQLAAIAEPNGAPWPATPSAPPQKLNIAAPPPPHADSDAPLSSVESRLRHASAGAPTTGAARLRGQEATGHLTPSRDRLRVSLAALVFVPPSAAAAGDPLAGVASPASLPCFRRPAMKTGAPHSLSLLVLMTGGPGCLTGPTCRVQV